MNTIRELIKFSNDKELDIEFPIRLYDRDGNEIYCEHSGGYWCKGEYKEGKLVYCEFSEHTDVCKW